MAEKGITDELKGANKELDAFWGKLQKVINGFTLGSRGAAALATSIAGGGTGAYSLGKGGAANFMGSSLGKISGPATVAGLAMQGVGQIAKGAFQGMPSVQDTMQYAKGYYGANIAAGGTSRKLMEQATFSAVAAGRGMTSLGADMRAASYLSSSGVNFSSAKGSTYMQTMNTASTLARYMNVPLEQGVQAVEGLTNASGAANMLRGYGIYTSDLATGKEKTMPQIFGELSQRLTLGKTTVEGTQQSFRKGALSAVYNQLSQAYGSTTADLFKQYMVDKAGGKSTNWLDDKSLGTDNPLNSQYDLNASTTKQYGKAEDKYIQGLKDSVQVISAVNDAMGNLAATVGNLNAQYGAYAGSTSIKGMGSMVKGAFTLGGTIIGGVAGALAGGVGAVPGAIFGGMVGNTLGNLIPTGGDKYGSTSMNSISTSRGLSGLGGDTNKSANNNSAVGQAAQTFTSPIKAARVTARLGQKGPYWDAQVGHRGTDFAAPQGTPVLAIGDGSVKVTSGGELGNQVFITHANGFVSHYCHMSTISVGDGSTASQGKPIGAAGNTGTNSHGAHLHFVLYSASGQSVDPFNYISGLTDASGAGDNKGSGASSYDSSSAAADSTGTGTAGSYIGASSLATSSVSGVSGSNNSASSIVGAGSTSTIKSPEAINGSSFSGGASGGSGTGYKTNAPSSKTGTDYVAQDGTYNLHQGESVRTAEETKAYREGKASGGGSGSNVTINVTVAQASEAEAYRMVKLMRKLIEDDKHIAKIGRS
jgi:hypothetical protein